MEYKLESTPYFYSTTEGEPELHPSKGSTQSAPLHWDRASILYLYTGDVIRDLAVETTPKWYGPLLNQPQGKHPVSFLLSLQGEDHATPPLCLHWLLCSK